MLFTTTGSAGHLGPLVPFADAVHRGGGDVLVATRASAAEQARAAGLAVRPFADAPAERRGAVMASLRGLPVDAANAHAATELFGGIDADAAIPGLRAICADAAVVVCHGGSGTVRGALAEGVPLVIQPLFADQPDNARRVVELGAGLAPGADGIGAAVREVLADPRYARAAAEIAADIRALPPVDAAADVLRSLA